MDKLYYKVAADKELLDREYLALMLHGETGNGMSAYEVADKLLERYGSIATIVSRSVEELQYVYGITPISAARLKLLDKTELLIKKERFTDNKEVLRTLDDYYKIGQAYYTNRRNEVLMLLLLDFEYRFMRIETFGIGDTRTAIADMGKLLSVIQMHTPRNVVLFHNHFSNANPSVDDIIFTNNLNFMLDMLNVRLVDHIVVCRGMCCSMRKNGYIKELPEKPLKGF